MKGGEIMEVKLTKRGQIIADNYLKRKAEEERLRKLQAEKENISNATKEKKE